MMTLPRVTEKKMESVWREFYETNNAEPEGLPSLGRSLVATNNFDFVVCRDYLTQS